MSLPPEREAKMRHEGRGVRWSWQKQMTDAEVLAEEEEWERRYRQIQEERKRAFRERGFQPPRQSRVNGPPADWNRWNALLDGVPVGHCWAFDSQAGWVEVWVVAESKGQGSVVRVANEPRRRLYGKVTVVSNEEHARMKEDRGLIQVWVGDERGEPVPGTEIRPP